MILNLWSKKNNEKIMALCDTLILMFQIISYKSFIKTKEQIVLWPEHCIVCAMVMLQNSKYR